MNVLILTCSPRLHGNTAELCMHADLTDVGLHSVQDENNLASFLTREVVTGAQAFAGKLMEL